MSQSNGWFRGDTECFAEVSNVLLMVKLNQTSFRQVAKYYVSRLGVGQPANCSGEFKCRSPFPGHVMAQVTWEWPPVHGMTKGCKPQS